MSSHKPIYTTPARVADLVESLERGGDLAQFTVWNGGFPFKADPKWAIFILRGEAHNLSTVDRVRVLIAELSNGKYLVQLGSTRSKYGLEGNGRF